VVVRLAGLVCSPGAFTRRGGHQIDQVNRLLMSTFLPLRATVWEGMISPINGHSFAGSNAAILAWFAVWPLSRRLDDLKKLAPFSRNPGRQP